MREDNNPFNNPFRIVFTIPAQLTMDDANDRLVEARLEGMQVDGQFPEAMDALKGAMQK